MTDEMYQLSGVRRPQNEPQVILDRGYALQGLSSRFEDRRVALAAAVVTLASRNQGPTVEAFSARMSGPGSADDQLAQLRDKAAVSSEAYLQMGEAYADGLIAMDLIATAAAQQLDSATDDATRSAVIGTLQESMWEAETALLNALSAAWTGDWEPQLVDLATQRPNQGLRPDVEARWQEFDAETQRNVHELMLRDMVERDGVPVPELEFFDADPGQIPGGQDGLFVDDVIKLDDNVAENPLGLATLARGYAEARYAAALATYDDHDADELVQMVFERPDAFEVGGQDVSGMQYLVESEERYEDGGRRSRYAPQSAATVDANRAVYQSLANLTLEDLEACIVEAG